MTLPADGTVTAWARLLRASNRALSTAEDALKKAGLPPLAWYDVLLELERAGRSGIRARELQQELLLPQYGISRLLARLEDTGYLERRACADDGRGQQIVITPLGRKMRRRMWPIYGAAIEDAVGSKLTEREIERLSHMLRKLI